MIIVPTVALAYDFERRFQDHYMRLNPRAQRNDLRFAWTGDTSQPDRDAFRTRLTQGRQPLLVTSPESMTSALRDQLLDLAGMGRLAGLVVDEAHLVTQWGRSFRPEFRTLGRLRSELLARAAEQHRRAPLTLLLSATMSSRCIEDLQGLFAQPGPCVLIAANTLRPEPEFWIAAETADDLVRQRPGSWRRWPIPPARRPLRHEAGGGQHVVSPPAGRGLQEADASHGPLRGK